MNHISSSTKHEHLFSILLLVTVYIYMAKLCTVNLNMTTTSTILYTIFYAAARDNGHFKLMVEVLFRDFKSVN